MISGSPYASKAFLNSKSSCLSLISTGIHRYVPVWLAYNNFWYTLNIEFMVILGVSGYVFSLYIKWTLTVVLWETVEMPTLWINMKVP